MASLSEKKSQPLNIGGGSNHNVGSTISGSGSASSSVGATGDVGEVVDAIHNESLTTSINSNLMSTSQISTTSIGDRSSLSITHHPNAAASGVVSTSTIHHFLYEI